MSAVTPSREQIAAALHEECEAPVDHVVGMWCPSATNHLPQADRVLALLADLPPRRAAAATARDPWTVVLAWSPDQNWGRVSLLRGRSPVFAIVGRMRAGEEAAAVADDYGCTVEEIRVIRALVEDITDVLDDGDDPAATG